MAGLKERVAEVVARGGREELEGLVAADRRAVRYLVALSYRTEPSVRETASRGIALAGRHHPRLVQEVARRLIWAMNDESGTHAVTAPEVLRAIAEEVPGLLVPLVPDILRLTGDAGLRDRLVEVARRAARDDPGTAISIMQSAMTRCEERRGT